MKVTATDIYGDLRELQSRLSDMQSSDAQQYALIHIRKAQQALLPLVQSEENEAMKEHLRHG